LETQGIMDDRISTIQEKIRAFRDARDWLQFHNPKDLAIGLSIEASELLEVFLWKDKKEVETAAHEKREQIEHELADVAVYLFELADILGIKLEEAIERKMAHNDAKYPVEKARGSHKKYTEL
jgi:NTP pyrophosphatase (non-canonical NTP hydrolase)